MQKLNNQVSHVMDGRTAVLSKKIGPADRAEMHTLLNAEFRTFEASLSQVYAAPGSLLQALTITNVPYTATNHIGSISTNVSTVSPTKL